MAEAPRIAIDAMGGDGGLAVMLAGVALARRQWPGLTFDLVGDEAAINAALDQPPICGRRQRSSTPPKRSMAANAPARRSAVPKRQAWALPLMP